MNKYFLSITVLPFLSVRNLIHIMNRSFLRTGKIIALAIVSSLLISCNEISFNMPNGPQGEAGRSAYEVWKEEVLSGKIQWPNDKVELTDFFFFCKGEKGDKGDKRSVCLPDVERNGISGRCCQSARPKQEVA